ncbi:MAG TPA: helix-turn-helix domain-containing protein [Verrucomicrobiae bacterium]|nr:helix-turn-helix domain-containing protein [Verrucomicrobiae bacterium]
MNGHSSYFYLTGAVRRAHRGSVDTVEPPVRHTVPAVLKAAGMLALIAREGSDTTIRGLAASLGIPRTSCYRILRSLMACDWVRPLEGGRHEVSLGLLPLVEPLRSVEGLVAAARRELEALAARTGLTAKLSVRRGDHAVTVARQESPQAAHIAVRIGAAFHLALGSSGSALLSALGRDEIADVIARAPAVCWEHQRPGDVWQRIRQVRAKGYSWDFGGYRTNCHAVSAPVVDGAGIVCGAATLVGFPQEITRQNLPDLARELMRELGVLRRRLKFNPAAESAPAAGARKGKRSKR